MSGGSFNYAYSRIAQFSHELQNKLDEQGKDTHGNGRVNEVWPAPVAAKLAQIARLSEHVSSLAKQAEWLYSGDIGEDTFMQRVSEIEAKATK